MKKDFHMHTFLSDGTPSPFELVQACLEIGLDQISITDHDSIGSYPAVFDLVKGTKLQIIPGAELDCVYGELEIHMLAFGLDIENVALNQHLKNIQASRRKRATEQAEAINRFFGRNVIELEKIFARCETFMNPHLIHAMLEQNLFDEHPAPDRYKQASKWMKKNIHVDAVIEKPSAEAMIRMIHRADGVAALAHPAYYLKNGFDLNQIVHDLKDMGMDALEVIYPYYQEGSREFPTPAHEREAISLLQDLARRYELDETTGSDAHHLEQLRAYHLRT